MATWDSVCVGTDADMPNWEPKIYKFRSLSYKLLIELHEVDIKVNCSQPFSERKSDAHGQKLFVEQRVDTLRTVKTIIQLK